MRSDAAMKTDLNGSVVGAGGAQHRTAFTDRVARWLFDKDVCPFFDRGDGVECMPMIGRGDDRDVDFDLVQQLAEICKRLRFVSGQIGDFFSSNFQFVLINVTKSYTPRIS